MEIKIFDVEHGFCAYIKADNGNTVLIDCGYNNSTNFRPSMYLRNNGCSEITKLIISNYDEDHVNDLPNLRNQIAIQLLMRNQSVTPEILGSIKNHDLGNGIKSLIDMMYTYNYSVTNQPDYSGLQFQHFLNNYPTFKDTNNLSLVTFVDYGNTHIIFPGDLEEAGWLALLQNYSFRLRLQQVNIFVASHHGRRSGYCAKIFQYCHPEIIIISDTNKIFDTQEVDYNQHASGRYINENLRKVLTTRNDGMITINQNSWESNYNISIQQKLYKNYY